MSALLYFRHYSDRSRYKSCPASVPPPVNLIIEQVSRAKDLADMIVSYIIKRLDEIQCPITDAVIANEGFSFASSGNAVLDLSGYKYILMSALIDKGFKDFRTYAPITIKKTAECSKKGMGKEEMIQAAGKSGCEHPFNKAIIDNPPGWPAWTIWRTHIGACAQY